MAKIRTHVEKVFGTETSFRVNYVAKYSRFEVILPEVLEKFRAEVSETIPHGESEAALVESLKTFINRYEKTKVVQRKVIAYWFDWSSKNINSPDKSRQSWNRKTSDEARIECFFQVLIERKVAGTKLYYTEGLVWDSETKSRVPGLEPFHTHGHDPENAEVIDWTQEREDFLKGFYASMEQLMRNMKKFVGTKKLLIHAAEKSLLLIENKTEDL